MQGDNNPAKREIIKLAILNTTRENFRTGKRKLPINNTAKGYFRPDINQYVRSNWEANIIRIFNFYKIKFEYEKPIPIILNEQQTTYFVDFYLLDYDLYIEIKGAIYSREKYDAFCQQYTYKSILIDKKLWKEITKLFSYIINHWEGRKQYNTEIIPSETIRQTKFFQLLNI